MLDTTADAVLQEIAFDGEIAIGRQTAPVTFRVSAGPDCRLRFDVDPVDADTYLLAISTEGAPGTHSDDFTLRGQTEDGKTIESVYTSLGSHGSGTGGHRISIRSRGCRLSIPLDRALEKPYMRLWFRSFLSHRNPQFETRLGRVVLHGQTRSSSVDEMSGFVAIEAPTKDLGPSWKDDADAILRHMHRGLSFAHGGRLQTPRLDFAYGVTQDVTFFEGEGFEPELPVQHQLNHGPFIEALVNRYESSGPVSETLWTALGWMQTHSTFDEIRFLTAMTALEAIIENELPEKRGTVIQKDDFRELRRDLESTINDYATLSATEKSIFSGKIAQLNQKVFSQKISALFDHYDMPRRDFEGDTVRDLIVLRNDIIHKGAAPDGCNIWDSIILARELVTRILLKEIGFRGRYLCYIGGRHDRDFP